MSDQRFNYTVYPKKYAHGFCFAVLCCGYTLTDFPISIRLTSMALWQSNDCPSASKATLTNMDNTSCEFIMNDCITTTKQSTTKPIAYFLGYTVGTVKNSSSSAIFHELSSNTWITTTGRFINISYSIIAVILPTRTQESKWDYSANLQPKGWGGYLF